MLVQLTDDDRTVLEYEVPKSSVWKDDDFLRIVYSQDQDVYHVVGVSSARSVLYWRGDLNSSLNWFKDIVGDTEATRVLEEGQLVTATVS
jgi:hypothetical protein